MSVSSVLNIQSWIIISHTHNWKIRGYDWIGTKSFEAGILDLRVLKSNGFIDIIPFCVYVARRKRILNSHYHAIFKSKNNWILVLWFSEKLVIRHCRARKVIISIFNTHFIILTHELTSMKGNLKFSQLFKTTAKYVTNSHKQRQLYLVDTRRYIQNVFIINRILSKWKKLLTTFCLYCCLAFQTI